MIFGERPWRLLSIAAGLAISACGLNQLTAEVVSLRECISTALMNNRALQIERINPRIAYATLSGSYGYYDPVFTAQGNLEDETDPGGFEPSDYTREPTVYDAEGEFVSSELTGKLPTGLTYTLGGDYAHGMGERRFQLFETYKVNGIVSVRQPLLRDFWTDAGRNAIAVNRSALKMSEHGVEYVAISTVNLVEEAYYELLYAREAVKVNEKLQKAKNNLLDTVKKRAELGQLTVLEERLAMSEVASVMDRLLQSTNSVALAENQLRSLMGHGIEEWSRGPLDPAEPLVALPADFNLETSWQTGLTNRPDIAQLRQDVRRNEINLRFLKNQLFPWLDVVGALGRRGANALTTTNAVTWPGADFDMAWDQFRNGDYPNQMVGVVFTMPLSRKSERANYRVGKELREQAQLRVKQAEEMVIRQVADAYHTVQTAGQRVAAARRAREYAASALEAEQLKLERGQSSVYLVLELQSDMAAAELAEVRARADYNQAASRLRLAEGTTLVYAGFSLDFGAR